MDFQKLLSLASKNQQKAEKQKTVSKQYSTELGPAKREAPKPKGVQNAAVRAFLEKKAMEEKVKESQARQQQTELIKLRKEVKHTRKANAMAKTTKDNLKGVFDLPEQKQEVTSKSKEELLRELEVKRQNFIQKLAKGHVKLADQVSDEEEEGESGGKIEAKETSSGSKKTHKSDKDSSRKSEGSSSRHSSSSKNDSTSSKHSSSKHASSSTNGNSSSKHKDNSGKHKDNDSKHKDNSSKHKDNSSKHKDNSSKHSHSSSKHTSSSKNGNGSSKYNDHSKQSHASSKDSDGRKSSDPSRSEKTETKDGKPEKADEKVIKPKKPIIKRRQQQNQGLSFEQLIALAEKKLEDPDVAQSKAAEHKKPDKKPPGPERPLTQDEKDVQELQQSKEYKHWYKFGGQRPTLESIAEAREKRESPSSREQNSFVRKPLSGAIKSSSSDKHTNLIGRNSTVDTTDNVKTHAGLSKSGRVYHKDIPDKKVSANNISQKVAASGDVPVKASSHKDKGGTSSNLNKSSQQQKPLFSKGLNPTSKSAKHGYDETHENVLVCGKTAQHVKSSDEEVKKKPAPQMSTWDQIYSKIQKNQPRPEKRKRQVIESEDEDEYDEEMDDFIEDDGSDMADFIDDGEVEDYSKHIKDIFGYDKNKYRHEREDDLRDMETSYSVQMKEEARSARLGLQEDLEDIRKEEEEMKRKQKIKKKKVPTATLR